MAPLPPTWTILDAVPLPPEPVQVSEKVLFAVSGPLDWLPLVGLVPFHDPPAMQLVALLEFHDKTVACPGGTVDGFADSDTVGGPDVSTVTATPVWVRQV
jgi:hypothetical protein